VSIEHTEPIPVHRLTVLCDPGLIATVDELRRVADGTLPSRAEIVREAIEEKAARTLNGNGRKRKA
jgi:Ribbon-helix-helix protein, copG family